MHLVLQVVFDYDIENSVFHNTGTFSDITELRNVVKKYYINNNLHYLSIGRSVQIIDMDKPVRPDGVSAFQHLTDNKSAKQYKTTEIDRDVLSMVICSKIMYPRDVRKILKLKYGSVLDFDSHKRDEKQPICDFYVSEDQRYGLRNPTTGAPTSYVLRNVYCRNAEPTDIIVNEELNQIWPKAIKQPPRQLTDLLAQKTENIIQR